MGRPVKYKVNNEAFSKLNEEVLYWLGFLMADGCVTSNTPNQQGSVKISVHNKDSVHLQKFLDFCNSNTPLFYYTNNQGTPVAECRIRSRQIVDDISKYGVVSRKSKTAEAIIVHNYSSFWRGVFDGDGWIHNKYNQAEVCGSKKLMYQFTEFCNKQNVPTPITTTTMKTIYRVRLTSAQTKIILPIIYEMGKIALDRKYQRVVRFLSLPN